MSIIRSIIPAIFLLTGGMAAAQVVPTAPADPPAPPPPAARAETELRAVERLTTPPTAPVPARAETQQRLAALEAQLVPGTPVAPTAPALAETRALLRELEAQQDPAAPTAPTAPATPMAFYFNSDGGYLGIATANVTDENASKLGLSEARGVVIERVLDGSPAATAGLQKDDVILKFEGEEVTSVSKLTRLVGEVAPDHKVKLRISRAGHEQDITVTLGKRTGPMAWSGNFGDMGQFKGKLLTPDSPEFKELQEKFGKMKIEGFGDAKGGNTVWAFGAGRRVGISTIALTKQLAEFFGVPSGQGVLVTNVNEDSPAAKSGIKAGDVITEVDGEKVDDAGDVSRSINKKTEGDVTLTVIRDRGQRMVTVTPEKGAAGFNLRQGSLIKPSVLVQPRINGIMPRAIVTPRITIPSVARPLRRTTVIL